jgi:hypothetical protein
VRQRVFDVLHALMVEKVLSLLMNTSMLWKISQAGEITFVVETDVEIDESRVVTFMKNELCSVPSDRQTDQDYLLPEHEYEELHGL